MDRLIKVSLEDMAMRLLDFEIDDELSFAVYFDEVEEEYQYHNVSEWYGVKLIELFDSVMFIFNAFPSSFSKNIFIRFSRSSYPFS